MQAFDMFDFYIQRKLFVHNLGHAVCAYLGMILGDSYIYEAVRHEGIHFITRSAMRESAQALSAKYTESLPDLHDHIEDLLRRFSNKALMDTCARVGGDITRKLGNKDRLIGAFLLCTEEGVDPASVSVGIAAALRCYLKENCIPQNREAAQTVLREVSGLGDDSAAVTKILSSYETLAIYGFPI
jgi:mannitol-1-phosphate 5-dehydrogenase